LKDVDRAKKTVNGLKEYRLKALTLKLDENDVFIGEKIVKKAADGLTVYKLKALRSFIVREF
jgi:hypothetical protein